MKSLFKTLTFTCSMAIATGLLAFKSSEKPANFTGTWVLNLERSEIGNAPVPKSGKSMIRILQQQPALIMEKSLTDSTGKVHAAVDTINFDGKPKTLNVGNGQQLLRTITQQWSADQQTMTLASKFSVDNNGEPVEFNGTETWKVSEDGKVLTIVNETVLPDRTDKITLVYTKQ